MIYGIGTDIVAVARIARLLEKHGELALSRILAPKERESVRASKRPEKALAKHWAAKEAFAKALGTGLVAPATLPAIILTHNALGKPGFSFAPELQAWLDARHIVAAHLSISDEADYAVASVILESGAEKQKTDDQGYARRQDIP